MSPRTALVGTALAYLLSRLYALAHGVAFDASPIDTYWQLLDPALLQHDLGRSLWLLHSQPPLFNALVGLSLKLGGPAAPALLSAVFHLLGLALHLAMTALMTRLSVRPAAALAVTAAFAFTPASLLYEAWLFYTWPVAALLTVAAVQLHRLATRPTPLAAAAFTAALAAVVLTRGAFHPLWLLAWSALALALHPRPRRRAALAAAAPLALVALVFIKNAALFGAPAGSTWLGMNLAKLTTHPLPPAERQHLADQGLLSPVSVHVPFSPLAAYADAAPDAFALPAHLPPHPALTAPTKSTGATNYNHHAYIPISRAYLADARRLIAARPAHYARSVARAALLFARPPWDYAFLEPNRGRLHPLVTPWDTLYGVPGAPPGRPDPDDLTDLARRAGWLSALLAAAATLWALWTGARSLRDTSTRPRAVTRLFVASTIAYVFAVGVLFELGENMRFRMMIEPLAWCLVAAAAAALLRALLRRPLDRPATRPSP